MSRAKDQPLVYVVGDSISIHYGPALMRSLKGFFRYDRKSGESEALVNLDEPMGANAGDSRRTLAYLRARFAAGNFSPEILLLNCGLHDLKRELESDKLQVSEEEYRRNLEQIVKLCHRTKSTLVWVRVTPVPEVAQPNFEANFQRFSADVAAYNACADGVMLTGGIPSIDLFTFTREFGEDRELYCDHVHFKEAVREAQGAFIAGHLVGLDAPQRTT